MSRRSIITHGVTNRRGGLSITRCSLQCSRCRARASSSVPLQAARAAAARRKRSRAAKRLRRKPRLGSRHVRRGRSRSVRGILMGRRAAAAAFVISAVPPRQHRAALALKAFGARHLGHGQRSRGMDGTEKQRLFFFHRDAQCMNSVAGALKRAGKMLSSRFLLQEGSQVPPRVGLATLATQTTLWSSALARVKNVAGI